MKVLLRDIDEDNNGIILASELGNFLTNKWEKNWKDYMRELLLLS